MIEIGPSLKDTVELFLPLIGLAMVLGFLLWLIHMLLESD